LLFNLYIDWMLLFKCINRPAYKNRQALNIAWTTIWNREKNGLWFSDKNMSERLLMVDKAIIVFKSLNEHALIEDHNIVNNGINNIIYKER